jgi:hypothetical protein
MDIREFGKVINKRLEIIGSADPDDLSKVSWSARFAYGEIKEDRILSSTYGYGNTSLKALRDYVRQIKGKVIVFGAYSEDRQTFDVPKSLTVQE